LDLTNPRILESRFQINDWRLGGLPDGMAVRIDAATEGGSTLNYNLRHQTVDGTLSARAQVSMADQSAADARVKVELRSVLPPAPTPTPVPGPAHLEEDEPAKTRQSAPVIQSVVLPEIDARVL